MDIRAYNRTAWDRQTELGNPWTIPVSPEQISQARSGFISILLTPTRPVPMEWFPELNGLEVLCLASGGGQQGPILAAAGARVTVFDNSPKQLARDRQVAERESLDIELVEGDMTDLSALPSNHFNLIVHPVSNIFIPSVRPVWREAFRVLRPGGSLLAGIVNPVQYIFDFELLDEKGVLEVRHSIPYSDLVSLTEEQRRRYFENGDPLEFGHTLEDQIGGQIDAGFLLSGFYEDIDPTSVLGEHIPTFIATRAIKP